MTRTRAAGASSLVGAGLVTVGAGMVYVPAAFLLAGALLLALGLFGVDVEQGS